MLSYGLRNIISHGHANIGEEIIVSKGNTQEYIAASCIGEDEVIPTIHTRFPCRVPMYVLKPKHLQWYEIDDEADLKFAESAFSTKNI